MANIKVNILQQPKHLLFIVSLILASVVFLHAPRAHAAACTVPTTDMGSVTASNISVSSTGTYRVFSRIMSGTSATDNSYDLEIDGSSCFHVGNSDAMPTGSWQWIDYQNGTTSSKIDVSLTAGNHTFKMIGTEDGVKLDRIVLTTDTTCPITGTGDNCASPSPPTVSLTSPAAGLVSGNVAVNSTASDVSSAIAKAELVVDGSVVGTPDTSPPYNFTWDSTTVGPGAHTLAVKVTDAGGSSTTSAAVSVTVDNVAPTVNMTLNPTATSPVANPVTLNATATDTNGIANVAFYDGTNLLFSDSSSPYSYSWNNGAATPGAHTLKAVATDNAGNSQTTTVSVTVGGGGTDVTPPTTSVNPITGAQSNTIIVGAAAGDDVGVTKVELYVDGWLKATDVAAPYSYSWTTNNWSNGVHTLKTVAYDAAGHSTTSAIVNVTITNSPATYLNGDINHSGPDANGKHAVNGTDLALLLSNWSHGLPGDTGKIYEQGNLVTDTNNIVNGSDLATLLSNWNN